MQTYRPVGMTIHRSRPGGRRVVRRQGGVSDAGAVLTILQIVLCVVLLVVVFTLQFIDGERYTRAGELYRAVMSGEGEAMYVGAFGTPITKELLEDYADILAESYAAETGSLTSGSSSLSPDTPVALLQEQQEQELAGQGGESPYIPANLNLSRVLLSAKPVYPAYGVITSPFGLRTHPVSGKTDFHTGLDIAASLGDGVYAALPGRVTEIGISPIYGNYIRVAHAQGLESVYNHCSEILAAKDAVVRAGERIALVGSTGVSTGPHLHFDLLVNGCYTDPMQVYQ